jgi:hypothetical protein
MRHVLMFCFAAFLTVGVAFAETNRPNVIFSWRMISVGAISGATAALFTKHRILTAWPKRARA